MDIDVLYVPDCPNLALVRGRLHDAIDHTRVEASVREIEVATAAAAEAAGMHGSPTVLINGRDPFAGPDDAPSVSCRLYRSDGRVDGAPTVVELIAALAAAPNTVTRG